jgi:hypothetical protein
MVGSCGKSWILAITKGSKGSSKIIGAATAAIAALASLVCRSGVRRERMTAKSTASAVRVTGRMGCRNTGGLIPAAVMPCTTWWT